ncbi:MAG TPA: FkbM family methyltransferase [Longimicrobium sp.]
MSAGAPLHLRVLAWAVRRLPAGRYRVMNRVPRGGGAFQARLPRAAGGYAYACDLRDLIAREVFFTGAYGPQETAILRATLRPGATFVDVGANWGYFTLLAAHLVGGSGRVIAMEPDPRLHALLAGNAAANGLRQVSAVAEAASDREGMAELAGCDLATGNWGVSSIVAKTAGPRFEVRTRRIDELLDEWEVERVELLKMDIEGAEEMALAGMAAGLARGRYRRVLVELHPTLAPGGRGLAARVRGTMEGAGYRGWSVASSRAATRRAAYRAADARSLLQPLDAGADDAWPHQLWIAPGEEPL